MADDSKQIAFQVPPEKAESKLSEFILSIFLNIAKIISMLQMIVD